MSEELNNTHTIWEQVDEICSYVAYGLSKKYHRFVDLDDIKQSMNEYAWKRRDKVTEYLMRENEDERRMGYKAFTTFIRRAGERYARKEKSRALGFELGDEYFYRIELIENLIKVSVSEDSYLANQVFDPDVHGSRVKKLANEGNNLAAMVADVSRALSKLDPRTQGILNSRAMDIPLAKIAEAWDISPQRVEQISTRGVREILEKLGGPTPYA